MRDCTFPDGSARRSEHSSASRSAASITAVNADIGDRVGRGSVLASLSATTYRYQLSEAEAQLAETRAQLAQARLDAARQERLYEEGAASETRLETARAQAGSLASLADARSAQIDVAREALSDTSVRAPFSGRIARRLVEPGTQVSPGQPILELDGERLEAVFVSAREPARRRLDRRSGDAPCEQRQCRRAKRTDQGHFQPRGLGRRVRGRGRRRVRPAKGCRRARSSKIGLPRTDSETV